jgi:hypothetical protein
VELPFFEIGVRRIQRQNYITCQQYQGLGADTVGLHLSRGSRFIVIAVAFSDKCKPIIMRVGAKRRPSYYGFGESLATLIMAVVISSIRTGLLM